MIENVLLAGSTYLDGHDVRYLSPAEEGRFGLPVGNGDLAAMVWTPADRLQFTVNKSNAWDDAPDLPVNDWHWSPITEEQPTALVSCAALSIRNHFPCFDTTYLDDFEARLHLREGYVSVDGCSPMCRTRASVFVVRDPDVLAVDYEDQAREAVEREIVLERWASRRFSHWYAQIVRDTNVGLNGTSVGGHDCYAWLEQKLRRISFAVVARFVGAPVAIERLNQHTVRMTTERARDLRGQLFVAVVTSEEHPDPLTEARRRVDAAAGTGIAALVEGNARRWAEFWSQSFVRLPDPYLENLYYFSLYQLGACAGSTDAPPHPYGALWLWNHDARPWGAYYHWVTQQLTWPVHAAGHPELAQGYNTWRFRGLDHAREIARKVRGIGGAFYTDIADRDGRLGHNGKTDTHLDHNLTCGSQSAMDMWRHFLFTGDEAFLRERAYPVMTASSQLYLECMERDEAGVYHVPPTTGYEGHLRQRDCVADLAVIRQSFAACIEAAERLGVDHELRARWQDVLDHLPPFTVMEHDGQKVISSGVAVEDGTDWLAKKPFNKGDTLFHRGFWLPMAPVFPSGMVGLAQVGTELFEAACNTVRIVGPTAEGGWIASGIWAARLGLANLAAELLAWYVKHCQRLPQGFLQEGMGNPGSTDIWAAVAPRVVRGGQRVEEKVALLARRFDVPEINCNCSLMTIIQEMLFQSHDGVLRVFPAVPAAWSDASFRLHAVGGFVVTAARQAGETAYVQVQSLRGGRCLMANPWLGKKVVVEGPRELEGVAGADVVEFPTAVGGVYVLRPEPQVGGQLAFVDWHPLEPGPRKGYERFLGIARYF